MHLLVIIRSHCTLFLVLYVAHFIPRSHGQAALDFMDMESTTLSPPQETSAPCKGDRDCEALTQEFDPDTKFTGFCTSPPYVPFATLKDDFLEQTVFPKDSIVSYECQPGYEHVPGTNRFVACVDDGKWSPPDTFCKPRSCGNPGDVDNGMLLAESFNFGARVTYACNVGYRMTSRKNYRDCQENGRWSNELPECIAVSCPSPTDIVLGHYYPKKADYAYLDSVTYKCMRNLALIGEQTISCTEEGIWSSNAPECKAVQCPNPYVENTTYLRSRGPYTMNSVVRLSCTHQYKLIGSDIVTCNQNSEWEPELPKCVGICRSVPKIPFAELVEPTTEESFLEGTTLKFRCMQGYELVSVEVTTVTCSRLQWSYPDRFCKPITCVEPEPVPYGKMSGSFSYKDRIQYTCETGYIIKHNYRTCQSDRSWSLPIPECEVQTCATPEYVNHGWFGPEKEKYLYNDTITYGCHEGFQLVGQASTTCGHDGRWNYQRPVCRGICDNPPDLPYAQLDSRFKKQTTFFAGDKVQYNCRPGYIPSYIFPSSITCLGNFTWSNIYREFCNRTSCGSPRKVAKATFEAKDFLFESEAIYKCEKGFKMVSETKSVKCGANGRWSGPLPICEVQKCSPPEDLKNGSYSIKKDEYTYNEAVIYKCNTSQLVGKASVICTDEGKWSSGAPQCKAVCTFPPQLYFAEVEKEFIQQEFFDIGKIVQYKCRPGFVPVTGKSNKFTCLNDLKWSQHELFCTRISCGNPGEIEYGQMQSENFLFGSRVNYTCNPGYSIITKRNYRECQADGTWSGKPPVCKEPVCDHIWELQEEARKCTSTPDEWIKYLQVQYLYLQIENLKLDIEIKKRQLDSTIQSSPLLHK
ncbi:C4b-binding protein alpha chain-like isoform X2 [Hyla sarda]|uniref:C4b-binding protein alpha chain-like isoform X2 n=1 Tax=Hyla sarda TaxID=327740 RepID=UPI0024C3EABA|nr:C4b-binding protein alpha chain-like isoform X2 [Hyla sarda]